MSEDNLGLGSIGGLSSLLNQDNSVIESDGKPKLINLSLIDEDPCQPRKEDNPGFSVDSLEELASTISERGVKTPISVRRHPSESGRYMINHGARRFRASKLAGKHDIPAFIDDDYLEIDQVIENLQRNELTAREIADYIGRELAKGKQKQEIAKELGKSRSYVTQHIALLDLPDPIAAAFNQGRVSDITVINELVSAFKKDEAAVEEFLSNGNQEINRTSVKLLRDFVDSKGGSSNDPDVVQPQGKPEKDNPTKNDDPSKLKKAILQVEHGGRLARLILSRRPAAHGFAWFKYEDDGMEFESDLSHVKMIAVMEG